MEMLKCKDAELKEPPNAFECPITHEIMLDPVIDKEVSGVRLCSAMLVFPLLRSGVTMACKWIWFFGAVLLILFHLPCNQEPVGESPGLSKLCPYM